jgi:hypothetical protein
MWKNKKMSRKIFIRSENMSEKTELPERIFWKPLMYKSKRRLCKNFFEKLSCIESNYVDRNFLFYEHLIDKSDWIVSLTRRGE